MSYTFSTELFSDLHKDAFGYRPQNDHPFYSSSDAFTSTHVDSQLKSKISAINSILFDKILCILFDPPLSNISCVIII